jgi:hypothetical protein
MGNPEWFSAFRVHNVLFTPLQVSKHSTTQSPHTLSWNLLSGTYWRDWSFFPLRSSPPRQKRFGGLTWYPCAIPPSTLLPSARSSGLSSAYYVRLLGRTTYDRNEIYNAIGLVYGDIEHARGVCGFGNIGHARGVMVLDWLHWLVHVMYFIQSAGRR